MFKSATRQPAERLGGPFAPTSERLEAAIEQIALAGDESGSAVSPAARRAAFAQYEALPIPGTRPARGWRHDYAKLSFAGLQWEPNPEVLRVAAPRDERALAEPLGGAKRTRPEVDVPWSRMFEPFAADKFAQLAIAFQNCGAYIYVPEGVVLEEPIQLVFSSPQIEPYAQALFPQIVVVLGKGARATVLERHLGEGQPFLCGIVAAHLADGANLEYGVVQNASEEARLFVYRNALCQKGATIRWHLAELGGMLARSVVAATLDGHGAHAQTAALFFNTRLQHADLTTTTDHAAGATSSQTIVRSAATDRGQGRYFGNIVIRKDAHGADASLRDDALLLSRHARIESVPALEIGANDVKAFHGATVGSLDDETLFYVQSRGISRSEAIRMVALAFFEPAITPLPNEHLRDEVRSALDRKLDEATEIDA